MIKEFQKSGDSEEVAAVKAYNSLLPLYREDLKDVLLEELKWTYLEKGPHLSRSNGNQRRINGAQGICQVRIHTTGNSREAISTAQAV